MLTLLWISIGRSGDRERSGVGYPQSLDPARSASTHFQSPAHTIHRPSTTSSDQFWFRIGTQGLLENPRAVGRAPAFGRGFPTGTRMMPSVILVIYI
jgi:hypothetical protein